MLVLQNAVAVTPVYYRREADDRYTTVASVDEATKFESFEEIRQWFNARAACTYMRSFPQVKLVEVREVHQPKYEVVKVIG